MERLLCARCGDSIHPDTAARNGGLCMPCVRGNQLTIEQRKEKHAREREIERAWRESPEWTYWLSLVDRVHGKLEGFDALARGHQLYYLINCLNSEVHNGGFHQFFSNSSGNRYEETVRALQEVGDQETLKFLLEAKSIVFSEENVPVDQSARYGLMPDEEDPRHEFVEGKLDELNRRFYDRVVRPTRRSSGQPTAGLLAGFYLHGQRWLPFSSNVGLFRQVHWFMDTRQGRRLRGLTVRC